jgi:predicted nucleotide-binding protein
MSVQVPSHRPRIPPQTTVPTTAVSASAPTTAPILGPLYVGAPGAHAGGESLSYLRTGIADRKRQAIARLEQAVRGLEEEIEHRPPQPAAPPDDADTERSAPIGSGKVFIVHGHDEGPREAVARFIEKLGFEAIILHERSNKGRTIITKFREEAAGVGFAIVLMMPDDVGKAKSDADLIPRARQNVIFELGFFIGALGPDHVAALVKGDIELPSDYEGVVYTSMDKEDWRTKLAKELEAAHYDIDWTRS